MTDLIPSPIIEAMIEVRFGNSDEVSPDKIEDIVKKIIKFYPNKHLINSCDVNIIQQSEGENHINFNSQYVGQKLTSNNEDDIAFISVNSIAAGRIAPYLGWQSLYDKFVLLWNARKKILNKNTTLIDQINIRYINRIDIPITEGKILLQDYLNIYPIVPEFSNLPLNEYLIQTTMPIDTFWSVTIITTSVPSPLIHNMSLILDINLFRTKEIPLNSKDLLDVIKNARNIKNDIFDRCITEKSKGLFQ